MHHRDHLLNGNVIMPLALPGLVAGSIFTFSLTLGDYVTPLLVGGANSTLIGNAIYDNLLVGGNLPLAAALATVPIAIMVARRSMAVGLGRAGLSLRADHHHRHL